MARRVSLFSLSYCILGFGLISKLPFTIKKKTIVADGGGKLFCSFPLLRLASIKMFRIMKLLKSLELCSNNPKAVKPIQFKVSAASFTLDTESKYFTVCKKL